MVAANRACLAIVLFGGDQTTDAHSRSYLKRHWQGASAGQEVDGLLLVPTGSGRCSSAMVWVHIRNSRRRGGHSDANKRKAAAGAVANAAERIVVVEDLLLVNEFRCETSWDQRHFCEYCLEVRDAGAVIHVNAVLAQLGVDEKDLQRFC